MNMKKIGGVFLFILIMNIGVSKVDAADASLSFYPSSGVVESVSEGFTVDILVNSGGYELSKARAVIKFDPSVIQLRKAMRNSGLFADWPTDQSSTDNGGGIVMLTGITTSDDTIPFYKTSTSADVLARLEFEIIDDSAKEILLSFEYSGDDVLFKSVLLSAGKDSDVVLNSQPLSAKFIIDESVIPQTSIDTNTLGIILGMFFILIGGFVRGSSIKINRKSRGTVVLERE